MIVTTGRSTAELEAALGHIRASPADEGRLALVVRRLAVGQREVLDEATLDARRGLVGDAWTFRPTKSTSDGSPNPLKQVTVMNARMVAALADTAEEQALAGDQLYVDLDLSLSNVPTGSLLSIGAAVLEVTRPPHRGCPKFVRAFGTEAMKFVNSPEGRQLRLRGLNARVVRDGTVRPGDPVRVSRPSEPPTG